MIRSWLTIFFGFFLPGISTNIFKGVTVFFAHALIQPSNWFFAAQKPSQRPISIFPLESENAFSWKSWWTQAIIAQSRGLRADFFCWRYLLILDLREMSSHCSTLALHFSIVSLQVLREETLHLFGKAFCTLEDFHAFYEKVRNLIFLHLDFSTISS